MLISDYVIYFIQLFCHILILGIIIYNSVKYYVNPLTINRNMTTFVKILSNFTNHLRGAENIPPTD